MPPPPMRNPRVGCNPTTTPRTEGCPTCSYSRGDRILPIFRKSDGTSNLRSILPNTCIRPRGLVNFYSPPHSFVHRQQSMSKFTKVLFATVCDAATRTFIRYPLDYASATAIVLLSAYTPTSQSFLAFPKGSIVFGQKIR